MDESFLIAGISEFGALRPRLQMLANIIREVVVGNVCD